MAKFRSHRRTQTWQDENNVRVSIALFGQPGSGKSSLINRLTGQNLAEVGVMTDKTRRAEAYEWNGIHLVDLPGYDTQQFPKEQYFEQFAVDSFDLFLCVFSGKLRQADTQFFQELQQSGKICLFVRNKSENIWEEGKKTKHLYHQIQQDVSRQVGRKVEVYFTSCRKKQGIKDLIKGITEHLDDAKRVAWIKAAKAYSEQFLKEKRKVCKKQVWLASGAAAANGINPIPGANVGVDVSILVTLFAAIRRTYELTEEEMLKVQEMAIPAMAHVAKNVVNYGTTQGVLLLLKRFASREIARRAAAYIPFVGQAIASTAGFIITRNAGMSYLEDCHALARSILEHQAEMEYDTSKEKETS